MIVAQDAGFGSWDTLIAAQATGTPPHGAPYVIDSKENRVGPSRRMTPAEWDELIGVMRERRIPRSDANGLMTDAALGSASLHWITSPPSASAGRANSRTTVCCTSPACRSWNI